MNARSLSSLLTGAQVVPLDDPGSDPMISDVAVDSRRVGAGSLFFALPGSRVDGASFIAEAVARGARAVLGPGARPPGLPPGIAWVRVDHARRAAGRVAREWHGRPDEAMALVGVTGTNGKTTVVHLMEAIAAAAGRRAARIGTVGYAWGGREVPAERTTPEFTELFEMLRAMREAGTEIVAMEVSSHALSLGRVEGARFRVAAFLNLGRDHLDFHRSVEGYFEAKASLFDRLGPDDRAVLPAEDPRGEVLARRTRARVIRFGRSGTADVRIESERRDREGSAATIKTPDGSVGVRTRLVGDFNVDNVAAAAACAVALRLPLDAVAAGAEAIELVPGRLEPIGAGQPFAVFVDYAHTPEALRHVLRAVRNVSDGRVILVFGCGGDRDRGKRPEMGRAAAEGADLLFLTSDNPRSEDPMSILRDVLEGVTAVPGATERSRIDPDRATAIRAAVAAADAGDSVVIAGKGHETTQTFADRVERFDDREVVRAALLELGFRGGRRGVA